MAFCRNCGAEISAEAFVCTKCGVLVNRNPKAARTTISDRNNEFHHTATFWLLFTAAIFFAISVLCSELSLLYIDAWAYGGYVAVHPDFSFGVLSLISSSVTFILIVITYITSFNAMREGKCTKTMNMVCLLILICTFIYLFSKMQIL